MIRKLTEEEKKERQSKSQKKWREGNKKHVKKYTKQWREENKTENREYHRKWREENKDHFNEYQRNWREQRRMKMTNYTGNKIKELRKAKRWTQTELGEKIYMGQNAISKYEKGECEVPILKLKALAKIFKVKLSDLVGSEKEIERAIDFATIVAIDFTSLQKAIDDFESAMNKEIEKFNKALNDFVGE